MRAKRGRAGSGRSEANHAAQEQKEAAAGRSLVHLAVVPAAVRRRALASLLDEEGFLAVSDIARRVGVSEMTIRRDLDAFERSGLIERAHGGAVPAARRARPDEPLFAARRLLHAEAKAAIARAAMELIGPNDMIGLDIGSTIACLAEQLCERNDLRIVTNSIPAVLALSAHGGACPAVYLLGGQLRPGEGSLCGPIARRQLAEHWLQRAFVSVASVSEDGLFDYAPEEAELKHAMMARTREAILLCDSSKFGQGCFVRVAGLEAIHTLITEAEPPAGLRRALERAGKRVIIAETKGNGMAERGHA
ncbi:MAG TPA: DeoR/GlpR family DNA-binding transcription regulator [Acetobacteraceae bacterium]|nr:DeoR/GlpR family DNA-binding transcription regulator [Acetobacteraceae bacterium]